MFNRPSRILKDTSGATAIEYALILAFIALVLVVPLSTIGPKIAKPLDTISAKLN